MKKTLFLSAILGAALCSSAFGAVNQELSASGTITCESDGDHLHYAMAGGALTYGCDINVGSYSPWVGPGSGSATQKATGPAYVTLSGKLSGTGSLRLNEWTRDVVYKLTGDAATTPFSGTIRLNHGGDANNTVQLSLGNNDNAYTALSSASVQFEDNKNKQVLSVEGNVTLAGLQTNCANSWVTSDDANNTLTLNVTANKSYAGYIGTGSYFSGYTGSDSSITLTSATSTALNITKTGTATQTFSGTVNIGELTISDGGITLSGTATVAHITNNGTLTLSGTTNLSATQLLSGSDIAYGLDEASATANGDGFVFGTRTYHLVDGEGTVHATNARFTDGLLVGTTIENGDVTVTGAGNHTYYVHSNTLNYTSDSAAAAASTTGISVENGATITIGSGATLNASKLTAKAATTLTGSGTYVLAADTNTLGTNVSKAADWSGWMEISSSNANNHQMSFANLGNNIKMHGYSGWDNNNDNWNKDDARNYDLTNGSGNTSAFAWRCAASSSNSNVHGTGFTGTWTGTGTFLATPANYMNYSYSGDISGWTGTFRMTGGSASSTVGLTFTGNATAMNAAIENTQGILNVTADANVTFSKALTGVTKLTINAGKSVAMQQNLTVGSLQMGTGSSLTFSDNKLLEVDGASALNNLTVQDLQFKQFAADTTAADVAYTVSLSGTNTVGGTLDMARGSNNKFAAATMLITADSSLTHNGSNLWMKHTNNGILLEEGATFNRNVWNTTTQYTVKGLSSAEGQRGQILWTPESGDGSLTDLNNANVAISNAELTMKYSGTISTALSNVVLKTGTFATTVNTDAVLTGLEISQALTINSGKTVTLNGTANYTGETATREVALTTGNGYGTVETYAQVISGEGTLTGTTTWTYNGQATTSYNNGELITNTTASSIYYVNEDTAAIDVVAGETFRITTASDITVNSGTLDYANITAGQTNINSVTLAGEASLVKGIFTLTGDGASITPIAGQTFDIAQTGSTVSNGDVAITVGDYPITFFNKLENVNLTYTNTVVQNQTLKLNNENTLGDVTINSGATLEIVGGSTAISGTATLNDVIVDSNASLTFSETEQTIGALTLHAGATVTLGTEESHDAALNITDLTVTGAAVMNANLVVESGTLNFAAGAVLTMGCEVTISGSSVYVTIDGTFDDFMADLRAGNALVVIDGLDSEEEVRSLTLNGLYIKDSTGNMFTNNELSLRVMESSGFGAHGNYCIVVAPEPATATLSLLALAALCARRKRH